MCQKISKIVKIQTEGSKALSAAAPVVAEAVKDGASAAANATSVALATGIVYPGVLSTFVYSIFSLQ